MASHLTRCIYCESEFDPRSGEGDHVLPRGFGDFQGALIFRGVCTECNNSFGALEEQLLRTAPEAVMRRLVGEGKSRRGKPIGWQGASGVAPPSFTIMHDGHEELVDADPQIAGTAYAVDQLVVVRKNGESVQIRLNAKMSVDAVRQKLVQLAIDLEDVECAFLHSDEQNNVLYRAIIQELWPGHRYEEKGTLEAGMHRKLIRIKCRYTDDYYRAIAKIAFHYFLSSCSGRHTGAEARFSGIRDYIVNGGRYEQYFHDLHFSIQTPIRIDASGALHLPVQWMHRFYCIENWGAIVVAVCLFIGPERLPEPYFVTLMNRYSMLKTKSFRYGHWYDYGGSGDPAVGRRVVRPIRDSRD